MIFEEKSIVKSLVDLYADCAKHAIDDNDLKSAVDDYNRLMNMFLFVAKIGYILNETGLKCRVDAFNIFNLLKIKGAFS